MEYAILIAAFIIGCVFSVPPAPDAPSRLKPLRMNMTLELSAPSIQLAAVRAE